MRYDRIQHDGLLNVPTSVIPDSAFQEQRRHAKSSTPPRRELAQPPSLRQGYSSKALERLSSLDYLIPGFECPHKKLQRLALSLISVLECYR